VSASLRDKVQKYIEHQAQRHKKRSFEKEFSALLKKCGIEFESQAPFGDEAPVPAGLPYPSHH